MFYACFDDDDGDDDGDGDDDVDDDELRWIDFL